MRSSILFNWFSDLIHPINWSQRVDFHFRNVKVTFSPFVSSVNHLILFYSCRNWETKLCKGIRLSHRLCLHRRPVFNQGHGPIPFHCNVHSNHDLDIIQVWDHCFWPGRHLYRGLSEVMLRSLHNRELFRAEGGNSPFPPEGGGDGRMRAENWRDFQDESAVGQVMWR